MASARSQTKKWKPLADDLASLTPPFNPDDAPKPASLTIHPKTGKIVLAHDVFSVQPSLYKSATTAVAEVYRLKNHFHVFDPAQNGLLTQPLELSNHHDVDRWAEILHSNHSISFVPETLNF